MNEKTYKSFNKFCKTGFQNKMLKIFAYNAGKGDCIRLNFDRVHNVFIDTGVTRFASRLKDLCYEIRDAGQSFDILILTHVDEDHIGGLLSLLRMGWQCPFREVRMNHTGVKGAGNTSLSTQQNDEVYNSLTEQGISVLPLLAGMGLHIGRANIQAIWPDKIVKETGHINIPLAWKKDYGFSFTELAGAYIAKTDRSINNKNSVVLIFEYEGHKLLFLGDAWAEDIITALGKGPQHFDMVKLSHHGAVGNISEEFKNHICCDNYLICTDGILHPDKQTIAKLIDWYGKITVFSPSDWWSKDFFTEKDNREAVRLLHRDGLILEW